MTTRIGIDVGGTFTDLILLDEESGEIIVGKGPSDPAAVDQAVRGVLSASVDRSAIERAGYFLHGTTVGLNALLERKGARVGLLTTAGFRDVLDIRRLLRIDEHGEHMWDHLFKTPEPLVSRPLRLAYASASSPTARSVSRSIAQAWCRRRRPSPATALSAWRSCS